MSTSIYNQQREDARSIEMSKFSSIGGDRDVSTREKMIAPLVEGALSATATYFAQGFLWPEPGFMDLSIRTSFGAMPIKFAIPSVVGVATLATGLVVQWLPEKGNLKPILNNLGRPVISAGAGAILGYVILGGGDMMNYVKLAGMSAACTFAADKIEDVLDSTNIVY